METENFGIPRENHEKIESKDATEDTTDNVESLERRGMETSNLSERQPGNEIVHDEKAPPDPPGMNNGTIKHRKKHRRGSKKNKPRKPRPKPKYKPYDKLTWDEKRKLDEIDAVKAVRKREELALHKGRAIAPYNTTQFLMEEHDPDELGSNLSNHEQGNDISSSCSSDEYYEKDFNEFYDNVHNDTLSSYSKEDLIKNVYELERKIETLQKHTKNMNILIEENSKLSTENKQLKEQVMNLESPKVP